jgi:hypothetical protein
MHICMSIVSFHNWHNLFDIVITDICRKFLNKVVINKTVVFRFCVWCHFYFNNWEIYLQKNTFRWEQRTYKEQEYKLFWEIIMKSNPSLINRNLSQLMVSSITLCFMLKQSKHYLYWKCIFWFLVISAINI